jgi:hypothetical protein
VEARLPTLQWLQALRGLAALSVVT